MSDSIVLDFLGRIGGRRIIVFGAGPTAVEFLSHLPMSVAYLVDNDERWRRRIGPKWTAAARSGLQDASRRCLNNVLLVIFPCRLMRW